VAFADFGTPKGDCANPPLTADPACTSSGKLLGAKYGRGASLLSQFIMAKMISFPRQARDKHRESAHKEMRFSQVW